MSKIEKLKLLLLNDNILKYEEQIFNIIPILKFEKHFDQKSEWHCYDVWNHTIKAVNSCDYDFEDRLILLLHDIGKPFSYQDDRDVRHFVGHAFKSKEISDVILKDLGYREEKINEMCLLISKHSTTINIDEIDMDNINFYKRLLKIQKCDGRAYEEKHSKIILDKLFDIEESINNYERKKHIKIKSK